MMTFSNFQWVTYLNLGRFKLKMSGDFYHGGGGSTGSDGAINSGFDPLDAASTGEHGSSFSNNNDSHGVDQRAAYWKEYADRSFKEYFSNCPGGPASSAHGTGQAEQSNTVS